MFQLTNVPVRSEPSAGVPQSMKRYDISVSSPNGSTQVYDVTIVSPLKKEYLVSAATPHATKAIEDAAQGKLTEYGPLLHYFPALNTKLVPLAFDNFGSFDSNVQALLQR